MRFRPLLLVSLLFALTSIAHAASFDCKLAHTAREKAVCANAGLSKLDDQLAAAYTATRANLSPAAFEQVKSDQLAWLKWLDLVCPPPLPNDTALGPIADCLTTEYNNRLQQFTDKLKTGTGYRFYPRYQVIFVKGKRSADDPQNPGFGYGAFAWPQIDDSTPTALAFNRAATPQALKVAGLMSEKKPADLAHVVSSDASGYTRTYFDVVAANQNLIEVTLGLEGYNWGGAHPDYLFSSFVWSPSTQRALTSADVFDSASQWKTKLIDPTLAKLKANKDTADMIIVQGADLRKGVAQTIADPTSWTLSPTALTLTFEPYAITAFAAGEPTVTFTWKELQPYLASNFDPASLPSVKPSKN